MAILGVRPDGTVTAELAVTADNELIVSGAGGGGGGGGDASAANQDEQTVVLEAIQAATETTALAGATEATLAAILTDTGSTSTATTNIDAKTPDLGQAAMTGSVPVVLASNQSAVQVSGPLTDTELRANPVTVTDGGTPVYVDLANVSMSFVPTLDQQHLTPNGGTWLRQNPSAVAASAPHSGSIVSISRGYLRSLRVVYTGALASGLFVQLHSASSLTGLSSGTMLSMGVEINTGRKDISWDIPELLYYGSGLIAAFSTTQATYTATVQTGFVEAHYTA